MSILSKDEIKHMKQIAHSLNPVVIIGDNGLSENVIAELHRALNDHELIKIKIKNEDKASILEAIQNTTSSLLIQSIGNVALIYRKSEKPNPKLSNLVRHKQ